MNGQTQIRKELKKIWGEGEANAAHIAKEYRASTGQNGWHITPFGRSPIFMGHNIEAALDELELWEEEHTQVKAEADAYLKEVKLNK